jgi:hypothetical protein
MSIALLESGVQISLIIALTDESDFCKKLSAAEIAPGVSILRRPRLSVEVNSR